MQDINWTYTATTWDYKFINPDTVTGVEGRPDNQASFPSLRAEFAWFETSTKTTVSEQNSQVNAKQGCSINTQNRVQHSKKLQLSVELP